MQTNLELERQTYDRELPRLLLTIRESPTAPRFALVHGAHVDSLWDTQMDAVRAGYRFSASDPFSSRRWRRKRRPLFPCSGALASWPL